MKSINKVTLIGHCGKQPEVRYTQSGSPVANFSLATNESWTSKTGERQDTTEWHRIVAWGKLAEICQEYVHKGSYLYIEGKIQTRSYDDRDGVKRYITEIKAMEIGLLDRKPGLESAGGEPPIDTLPQESGGGDDEVPF
jgi:single-strand DNA-binding protein